jgi:hypothetical protein
VTFRWVYLGGRYSRREELLRYAAELESLEIGLRVSANWLKGGHEFPETPEIAEAAKPEIKASWAREDLTDIRFADLVLIFTEPVLGWAALPPSKGGTQVELGYAIGIRKPILIVGPRINVFHYLAEVGQVDNWATAIAWIMNWLGGGRVPPETTY